MWKVIWEKFQVWISCLWLVSRPPKSGCFLRNFTAEKVLKSFSGRNNALEPPVFGFANRLPYGLEEPRELRIFLSTWLVGDQKCWKFPRAIFFVFLAAIMDLLITLKYCSFFFLISIHKEFQLVKYVFFIFHKTYVTLKMLLLSAQNNFYIILS